MDIQIVWEVMKWPLAACLILPPLLVYLGLHVVQREVIFVDLALAQVATLGTCVGLIMGYDFHDRATFWISLGVTFLGAALFSWSRSSKASPVPQEAIIGITFVVAAAGVILLLSRVAGGKEELEHLLTGLPPGDGLPLVATGVAEGVAVRRCRDPIEELHGNVGRHRVEEGRVDGGRHLLPTHSSERGATAPHSGGVLLTWL